MRNYLLTIIAVLLLPMADKAHAQSYNVARGKTAYQSSTYGAAPPSGPAHLAVDGNTSGSWFANSMSGTNYDTQAWWEVDLGAVYQLDKVRIWNRTDCCSERLSNFYVFVSDTPFNSYGLSETLSQSSVSSHYFEQAGAVEIIELYGTRGRYVRVQLADADYLTLAEVEVLVAATAEAYSTHSSGFDPKYAIDGDRSGRNWGVSGGWNDGTPNDWSNDWLEVRFDRSKLIDQVNVFSVQDNAWNPVEPTRTQTFTLYGLVDFKVQYWNGYGWLTVENGNIVGNNLVWREVKFSPVQTTKVRIFVTKALDTWTRIAEVEAIEAPVTQLAKVQKCKMTLLELEQELQTAIHYRGRGDVGTRYSQRLINGTYIPKWRKCLDHTLNEWATGGSNNLYLAGAAVGLFREPDQYMWDSDNPNTRTNVTYRQWWRDFLGYQVRAIPNSGVVGHFKGNELFSNIYDPIVTTAILSIRIWASLPENTGYAETAPIADYVRRYLRANWFIYALSAGAGPATSHYLPNYPDYGRAAPLRRGRGRYGGHFMAMAGARSNLDFWANNQRSIWFDRAIQYSNLSEYENQDVYNVSPSDEPIHRQETVRLFLPLWLNTSENLYGLSGVERDDFKNLIKTGDTSKFTSAQSLSNWLGDIRTYVTVRILGWGPTGSQTRVSHIRCNPNTNTPAMYAIKYEQATAQATFLYPWPTSRTKGSTHPRGLSVLQALRLTATRPGFFDDAVWYPTATVEMPIPSSEKLFHLVLSATQKATWDNSLQTVFPPNEPPSPSPDPCAEF